MEQLNGSLSSPENPSESLGQDYYDKLSKFLKNENGFKHDGTCKNY